MVNCMTTLLKSLRYSCVKTNLFVRNIYIPIKLKNQHENQRTHGSNPTPVFPEYMTVDDSLDDARAAFHNDILTSLITEMTVIEDFITPEEEQSLMAELEPYLKRMRYEFDHWDDAIHGYRETERQNWSPENSKILLRVKDLAFNRKDGNTPKENILPHVHVLDLSKDGKIKPHVDSTRFCGHTITGLSLLSDSVMRLVDTADIDKRNTQTNEQKELNKPRLTVNVILRQRSLYIMSHSARYNFSHEILGADESVFKDKAVVRDRRVSIICRNHPNKNMDLSKDDNLH